MPNPKRKHSKQRRDKRRTHIKATPATFMECTECGAAVKYHHVCTECGTYRGRKVLEVEAAV